MKNYPEYPTLDDAQIKYDAESCGVDDFKLAQNIRLEARHIRIMKQPIPEFVPHDPNSKLLRKYLRIYKDIEHEHD